MTCEQTGNPELMEKYVTRQLSEQDMSAFEEHYFACDDCLAEVQLAQAIQAQAPQNGPKVLRMPQRNEPTAKPKQRWMYPVAAAAAVVLLSVVGWRVFSLGQPAMPEVSQTKPIPAQATVPPAAPTELANPAPAEPTLLASNADLGVVTPLRFRATALRGANEVSEQRFQQVMASYLNGDYRQTISGLATIPVGVPGSGKADDHITDAGVQLYLGISQLMLNQNTEAVRTLRRAAAYGDTPYLENASFYLAKGLIRQKQYTEAARELQHVVKLNGDRQNEAKELTAKLQQAR